MGTKAVLNSMAVDMHALYVSLTLASPQRWLCLRITIPVCSQSLASCLAVGKANMGPILNNPIGYPPYRLLCARFRCRCAPLRCGCFRHARAQRGQAEWPGLGEVRYPVMITCPCRTGVLEKRG